MLQEQTRQLSPSHPRRSSIPRPRNSPGLHSLAAIRRSLPRCMTANSSSGLLHQLNYVSKNHTSLRAHIHTRCSPLLLIRPVTLSLQIDTSSVHRPTRTLHPCYQASRRVSPPHLLQSPARLSATQEVDPTAPTCDVTCTRYKLISHNHSLHALPFFTHPFQTPLKIHLRLT